MWLLNFGGRQPNLINLDNVESMSYVPETRTLHLSCGNSVTKIVMREDRTRLITGEEELRVYLQGLLQGA